MRIFALILMLALNAQAATYYVLTNGVNANSGTSSNSGGAWRNIWYAANGSLSGLAAADTVILGPGVFNEFVTNTTSGTAGNVITFQSPSGQTEINPSTLFTSGWTAAPEIGSGVYKQTGMAFATRELSIGNKRVMGVWQPGSLGTTFYTNGYTTGIQLLSLPTGQVVKFPDNDFPTAFNFWDGLEALYCSTGSICYLRLRDGSSPDGLSVRCAPNNDSRVDEGDTLRPTIYATGKSYITWSNVLVRGGYIQMKFDNSHHIVVTNCLLKTGFAQLMLSGGAYQNSIVGNELDGDFYGGTAQGSWGHNSTRTTQYNLWTLSKFAMCPNGVAMQRSVNLAAVGNSNVIAWNNIHHSIGDGITSYGTVLVINTNTIIASNTVAYCVDAGIRPALYNWDSRIFDNHLWDVEALLRLHQWDLDTARSIYFYRNTLWNPVETGDIMYFHFAGTGADSYAPTLWYYQNSSSGGYAAIEVGDIGATGLTNVNMVNNIFDHTRYINLYSAGGVLLTNSWAMGVYDYNDLTPPYFAATPWKGTHNITNANYEFANGYGMSFALTNGSPCINAGLDIPATYPTLPQDSTAKIGVQWDIGALEAEAGTTNLVFYNAIFSR